MPSYSDDKFNKPVERTVHPGFQQGGYHPAGATVGSPFGGSTPDPFAAPGTAPPGARDITNPRDPSLLAAGVVPPLQGGPAPAPAITPNIMAGGALPEGVQQYGSTFTNRGWQGGTPGRLKDPLESQMASIGGTPQAMGGPIAGAYGMGGVDFGTPQGGSGMPPARQAVQRFLNRFGGRPADQGLPSADVPYTPPSTANVPGTPRPQMNVPEGTISYYDPQQGMVSPDPTSQRFAGQPQVGGAVPQADQLAGIPQHAGGPQGGTALDFDAFQPPGVAEAADATAQKVLPYSGMPTSMQQNLFERINKGLVEGMYPDQMGEARAMTQMASMFDAIRNNPDIYTVEKSMTGHSSGKTSGLSVKDPGKMFERLSGVMQQAYQQGDKKSFEDAQMAQQLLVQDMQATAQNEQQAMENQARIADAKRPEDPAAKERRAAISKMIAAQVNEMEGTPEQKVVAYDSLMARAMAGPSQERRAQKEKIVEGQYE